MYTFPSAQNNPPAFVGGLVFKHNNITNTYYFYSLWY